MISENSSQHERPLHAIRRSASGLQGDFWDLLELQFQLFRIDSRQAKREFFRAVVAAVTALFLSMCALLMLSLGSAYLLAELVHFPMWAALGLVALIEAVLLVGLVILMLRWGRRGLTSFERTQSELEQNLRWLREVAKNTGNHADTATRRYHHE